MIEEILKAGYAAGYTEGVAASEGGYVDDVERVTAEWIDSEAAQEVLQQAGTCSASKKDWIDVLTKMNKVIQEAECISPVVKEIASSKVAWLRGDIVVGEYEKNC